MPPTRRKGTSSFLTFCQLNYVVRAGSLPVFEVGGQGIHQIVTQLKFLGIKFYFILEKISVQVEQWLSIFRVQL